MLYEVVISVKYCCLVCFISIFKWLTEELSLATMHYWISLCHLRGRLFKGPHQHVGYHWSLYLRCSKRFWRMIPDY